MILVTTTPSVDGYTITNYQGIVFGEVVSGVNMFKDLGAGLRNMFGGRSQGYEEELMRARNEAIAEMQQRAEAMGAPPWSAWTSTTRCSAPTTVC